MADSKGQLAGDLAAAAVSATLVAPTVTLLDRSLTEKASSNKPLLRGLRAHAIAALRHPGRFVFSRPFGLVWTLYAATYAVANATDTVTRETHPSSSASITFISTFAVNVPLGVWKDISFAQLFGNSPDPIAKTALRSTRAVSTAATATFLVRDAATIFGSFTLAPWCSELIPDSLTSHSHSKTVITQMVVPVLSQLVATPIHLIGLDLYNRQYA
ncbi:hypothetical protein MW887_009257 [Aspergillus wentii]|nr:hypothetical protein MW887_009257 [Aspergillus wentii]